MIAFERRGQVYHNLRKWDEAIADYTVAITKDPNNVMALRKRADTYYAMGQYAKALPDLETAQKLKPDDADIAQNLQHIRAKTAPPPKPVAQATAPAATPAPTPEPMDPRVKIGIGAGALLVLIIIVVMIARRKGRGY
jgi:tetratricopeptide (TPR) repeat protein